MSAATQAVRSAKTAAKRKARKEEELRLRVMCGAKQAMTEVMTWNGISEQGELMTLAIHLLHALGPERSALLLTIPRREYDVSPKYANRLDQAYARESLRICSDD